MRRCAPLFFFVALLLPAADAEFFETKIRPVLAKHCYACHSAKVKQPLGGFRLDSREAFAAAGLAVPGKPEESRLYRSLTYAHPVKMPPAGKLDDETLRDFHAWISAGAEYPATVRTEAPQKFWAFQPLRRPSLPESSQVDWVQTPVDAFVLKKFEQSKQALPARLDKRALLRRLTFDLTGLPPTPEELSSFLADDSPDAYKRAVDRLLGSPHYGERWARHWLDLVRYAETNGHEYDNDKLAPWRYRDYVIRAFNADLPYDQFLREHIAGDLLAKPRLSADGTALESPLATAFYYFGEVLNSTTDPVKSRADEVDNRIDIIGKAFTGLTVACARCHDHKFDPIPTREYYGIAGILHSTEYREVAVDSPARAREIARAVRGGALLPSRSTLTLREGDTVFADFNGTSFSPWRAEGQAFGAHPLEGSVSSLAAGAPEFVGTLTSPLLNMSDQRYLHVRLSGTKSDPKANERSPLRITLVCGGYKARHIVPDGPTPKWTTIQLVLERNRSCYIELVDHSRSGYLTVDEIVFSDHSQPPATDGGVMRQGPLLSVNVPPSAFAVSAADAQEAKDVAVHLRGNHQQLGDIAPRAFLSILSGPEQAPIRQGSGRLELAERLSSPANPLPARVMVNRLWKHHFGEGLVKSADNFGLMGERPRDQELLDYLATSFIESGWSVKSLHRLIVLSAYYQSTAVSPRRLEAEAIRDNLLAVSGRLDRSLFGPSIPPHIAKHQNGRGRPVSGKLDGEGRRSIYIQIRRNFIPPLYLAFDYPAPTSTIGVRGSSAVPSQALLLLNNEFVHEQARLFARSILALNLSARERLHTMYLRAFARPPESTELQRLEVFLAAQSQRGEEEAFTDVAHVLFNSPEFVYVR